MGGVRGADARRVDDGRRQLPAPAPRSGRRRERVDDARGLPRRGLGGLFRGRLRRGRVVRRALRAREPRGRGRPQPHRRRRDRRLLGGLDQRRSRHDRRRRDPRTSAGTRRLRRPQAGGIRLETPPPRQFRRLPHLLSRRRPRLHPRRLPLPPRLHRRLLPRPLPPLHRAPGPRLARRAQGLPLRQGLLPRHRPRRRPLHARPRPPRARRRPPPRPPPPPCRALRSPARRRAWTQS
mmetsp:Transcript_2767/g.8721  ORF Transcript_2767/g.8721 Transcript_2767/m.8721 type:complete len:236 (-) Transcript_2767:23-730(-)